MKNRNVLPSPIQNENPSCSAPIPIPYDRQTDASERFEPRTERSRAGKNVEKIKSFRKKKNKNKNRGSVFTPSDPPEYVRARPDLHHHVLLHQVEAHGDQSHAQHQVHGTQYEAELHALDGTLPHLAGGAVVLVLRRIGGLAARHEVTEPDGAQRYETEIRPVEKRPLFPFGEQDRSAGNVTETNRKTIYNVVVLYVSLFL